MGPQTTKRRRTGRGARALRVIHSGGGIRTRDLRVMSPTSYQAAPPRGQTYQRAVFEARYASIGGWHPRSLRGVRRRTPRPLRDQPPASRLSAQTEKLSDTSCNQSTTSVNDCQSATCKRRNAGPHSVEPALRELWRCRDSNPGPPTDPPRHLRAYPTVLFSSLAHRPAGGPSRTSRGSLTRAVTAPVAGQPEFSDTRRPASGRADRKMGGKEPVRASTYAARAKLSFAGNSFPEV